MMLKDYLNQACRIFTENNIDDASLESEVLVRHVLSYERVQLYQNMGQEFPTDKLNALESVINRRLKGEPSAYITNHKEFYGLDFYVNSAVLIPRPETEHLIEKTLSVARRYEHPVIADIGTGSGAIAISLATSLPSAKLFAVDISFDTLKVADINCYRHKVHQRISLLCGNLLEPLQEKADIIAANLPYVRKGDMPANSFEPKLALDGGEDGLDVIRLLFQQVEDKMNAGGHLLLEIGLGQKDSVVALLKEIESVKDVEVIPDLGGIDRIVCASFR